MKKILSYILTGVLIGGLFSCNDFLDEIPDNRADLSTIENIADLLVSAYPEQCSMYMAEMASDNADESTGTWDYEFMQREFYNWTETVTSGPDEQDSPAGFWQACYKAIASANMVLEAIDEYNRVHGETPALEPYRGEALVCRAYGHFLLVNIFSKQYCTTSATDLGIPYVTASETTVNPAYERGTVAGVYAKIEADLLEGMPLINDVVYEVKAYHFRKKATYAFAARFYLYYRQYDKVIEYADKVLGAGAAAANELRDWASLGELIANANIQPNAYIENILTANLLCISNTSSWPVIHGPYAVGRKYGHTEAISNSETVQSGTPWGSMINIFHQGVFWNSAVNRIIVRKIGYYFYYTDPVARIGYPYFIAVPFTTDETLLCRAEAYLLKDEPDFDAAVRDMNIFMTAFTSGSAKTKEEIVNYYDALAYYTPTEPTPKKALNPDFSIKTGDDNHNKVKENLIHAVLHTRRMLTLHEGLRWMDVNRYGIEIVRRQFTSGYPVVTSTLEVDDLRRVFQIPSDVITAGLEKNPR